jgi:hypothetical protein
MGLKSSCVKREAKEGFFNFVSRITDYALRKDFLYGTS